MILKTHLRGSLICMSLIAVGCGRPQRVQPDAPARLDLIVATSESDRLWTAAEQTLRAKRYPIDRLDRRNGVITTLPELSQHWFEFWRHDVATADDWAEASMNSLRRWVQVSLIPAGADSGGDTTATSDDGATKQVGDSDGYNSNLNEGSVSIDSTDAVRLVVVVHVERLSTLDRQFNSSGAAFQAFGSTLPATTGAVRVTPKDDRWIPLKTDPAMAERLLAAIEQTFHQTDTSSPTSGATSLGDKPNQGANSGDSGPSVDP